MQGGGRKERGGEKIVSQTHPRWNWDKKRKNSWIKERCADKGAAKTYNFWVPLLKSAGKKGEKMTGGRALVMVNGSRKGLMQGEDC